MEGTPLQSEQTLHPNDPTGGFPVPDYSDARKEYINFRRMRLVAARTTRDQPCQEHDDMPFLRWYETMKKLDDQYVAPRKNPQDTAINIGTVRSKDTSLLEYAQKFDFEPVAQVYDEDDQTIEDVAETTEDMVRKSLQMENFDTDKRKRIVRSMIAFGTAMVEDSWAERWTNEKTVRGSGLGSSGTEWTERLVKTYEGCEAKLWDLRKCYFGDIRKFAMNGPDGQPFFFTVEYVTYDQAKGIYGGWDMWKYVPTQVVMTDEVSSAQTYGNYFTLRPITINSVEVLRYYDPVANEFALTLNGIDMLPIMESETVLDGRPKTMISGFPLTEISPSGYIPFAKFDLEPMHDFALSKPQPAKMRVLSDIQNMMFKLMLRMIKQQVDPTMGNKSGRSFDYSVSEPGTVINDIRDGDLFPVLPNFQGPQANTFSMYEMVAAELSRNSVEDSFQGIDKSDNGKDTATKTLTDRSAQALSVSAMFDGIVSGMCQLFWLRTYNIAKNWTKPIDKQIDVARKSIENVYRTVTIPIEVDGGKRAERKVVFTTKTPPVDRGMRTISLGDSQRIHQDEVDSEKATGRETRVTYLHPELYRFMKKRWYYSCIPVPNDTDPLSYLVFSKQIRDAMEFFGPQSLNVKKLKRKFAVKTGQDFDTWFLKEEEIQQQMQMQQDPSQQPQDAQPTVGTAAKAAGPAQMVAGMMR